MTAYVIDTNVPVVANGNSGQADLDCVRECVKVLEAVRNRGVVVLDDRLHILQEYMNNLSMSGQPGVGDYFMKWVWQNQAVTGCCERVSITPIGDALRSFEEFPDDPQLTDFDRNDRKFVAVARASKRSPFVLNAVDKHWWKYQTPLKRHGVRIQFLCPNCVKKMA